MENKFINISIKKNNHEKIKLKGIKFNYIKLSLINKIFFIISLIIIYITYNKIRLSNNNNYFYNIRGFTNIKKVKYSTNSTLNKGFLEINTSHKGKYTYYDYASNIKIYKDLYKDISYTSITNNNFILKSEQISKEEFSKLCEEGKLLDKTKYKRNSNPKISVIMPYYIIKKKLTTIMALRSIQNQSLKDIEIIFVDDGSLEEKVNDILNEMKNDNRIILLRHKERKSTLLTRVDGIRYASGEYIIQIDQDDMYLNNLLFEKLYKKSKELDIDLIYFKFFSSRNPKEFTPIIPSFPKNTIIKQPELRSAFLYKDRKNRLSNCKIRAIWNLFTRRTTFMEAIEDLGDEYMNHIFRLYEDTIMMFELSQVAYSFYYYDIEGYRHCVFRSGQSVNKNKTLENEILAENQLLFIKLLLYKIDPKYDRYHIYKELGFGHCETNVKNLNKKNIDLGLEVVEAVFELERIYNNTASELIDCIKKIKKYYDT
jgi:glycosyltransferase involved in cell wall biosynthesis